MSGRLSVPLAVFAILLLSPLASALIESKTIRPYFMPSSHFLVERFGFGPGGSIEFKGDLFAPERDLHKVVNRPPGSNASYQDRPYAYICPDEEYQTRTRADSWSVLLCDGSSSANLINEASNRYIIPLNGVRNSITLTSKVSLTILVIDCSRSVDWSATVSYTLMSSPGVHVTLGEGENTTIFLVSFAAFLTLFIGYSAFSFLRRKSATPVHTLLSITLAFKTVLVGLSLVYWATYSSSGVQLGWASTLRSIFFALSEAVLFLSLFVIAQGFRITRVGLPATESRSTLLSLIVLVLVMLFFSFYETQYYWLSLIIMYFATLPKIFSALTREAEALSLQVELFHLRLGSSFNVDSVIETLNIKREALARTRRLIITYFLLLILSNTVLRLVLSWELVWLATALSETATFVSITLLLLNFLPGTPGLFFVSFEDARPILAIQNLITSGDLEEAVEGLPPSWDLSKTILVKWPFSASKPAASSIPNIKSNNYHGVYASVAYQEGYAELEEPKAKQSTVEALEQSDHNDAELVSLDSSEESSSEAQEHQ